jgi:ankyrin repeat protein
MYNDENTLKHLIQKGANIHKKDKFGRTPLFYAFVNDNDITNLTKYDPFEIVVYLAKDCDVVDIYGRNCLHYAAQRGSCMSAR